MATTLSLDRITGTASDVSILKQSEATLQLLKGSEVLKNGAIRSTYTVGTGDNRYPTILSIQTNLDPKGLGGRGQRSSSFVLDTYARQETDGVIDDIARVNLMLAINLPDGLVIEVADLRAALQCLYAITYATVTATVEENDRLSAVALFGVTEVLG